MRLQGACCATSHVFVDAGYIDAKSVREGASVGVPAYDEGFVLRSSLTGKPLVNRKYRVFRADGRWESGVTDAEGATHIIRSNCCETLRIELQEEGP